MTTDNFGQRQLDQGRAEGWPEFRFTLGDEEFRKQRLLVRRLLRAKNVVLNERDRAAAGVRWIETELCGEEFELLDGLQNLLDGLQNLLDAIADQAHDVYGVDCLLPELSET